MSFINDVMSEEADRKGLLLFEDYSVLRDVDFETERKQKISKINYGWNIFLTIVGLMVALQFVNQLPVSQHTSNTTYFEELSLFAGSKSGEPVPSVPEQRMHTQKVAAESYREINATGSPVEIKLEEHQAQLNLPLAESEKVAYSNNEQVTFEKKQHSDQAQKVVSFQYSHAQVLMQRGEVASAISELRQILLLDKYHLDARILLASTLIDQTNIPAATELYQAGLLLTPNEPRLAQPLAHLLVESGDINLSLQVLNQAAPSLQLDPEYHSFIAALQQRIGDHEKAIVIYQGILSFRPGNGKWWLGLGISLMAEARSSEALSAFEWALKDHRVPPALKQFASQRIKSLKSRES